MKDHEATIGGELHTRRFDYDGGRTVSVYLPPQPADAVVYSGDGHLFAGWGAALEEAGHHSTALVAVHHSDDPDEMVRIKEYSPTLEPARFDAHERFVLGPVADWAATHFGLSLPPARTAVAGVSASAELALALALRHPTRFGAVFGASPGGGYRPDGALTDSDQHLPRFYLTSGTDEPWFGENTTRWATALVAADVCVEQTNPVGDHGDPFWRTEFVRFVGWAFQ